MLNAKRFHDAYAAEARQAVIEIGSRIVTGNPLHSLRGLFPGAASYIGLDFEAGTGVDRVISDPYQLPIEDAAADVVLSSSCFEHAEFFWLSFLEMCRITKDGGLIYLNAPSNGPFHRYPVDCWRFYPDSGVALQNWARRNGHAITLLESYISHQDQDLWNDFVAVFALGADAGTRHPRRIVTGFQGYTNAITLESDTILQGTSTTEDQARRITVQQIAGGQRGLNWLGEIEGGAAARPG